MSIRNPGDSPKYWKIGIYHEELEDNSKNNENLIKEVFNDSFEKANEVDILHPFYNDKNLGEFFFGSFLADKKKTLISKNQNPAQPTESLNNQNNQNPRKESIQPNQSLKRNEIKDLIEADKYELLIAVTMYEEDPELFKKTMLAINKNLRSENCRFFKNENKEEEKKEEENKEEEKKEEENKEEEKKEEEKKIKDGVAVVVIVDGIKAFYPYVNHEYYKDLFNLEKIFNEHNITSGSKEEKLDKLLKKDYGIEVLAEQSDINDPKKRAKIKAEKLIAYCFVNDVEFEEGLGKIKVFFCVKQKNKRKLNSHLWFFRAFCKPANPEYVLLVDVGTEPEIDAIENLCRAFDDDMVAGVCGEIIPKIKDVHLTDLLYQTQLVEYKFAHIFDKALESLIGYITVLPGAFSAYRYKSLMIDDIDGPLWNYYFKSLRQPLNSCYMSNIYLAEDRVLCMALVTCKGKNNILKYVSNAKANTDPPTIFTDLVLQRRRWINGSWFALIDIIWHIGSIWRSGHNCFRKLLFSLMVFYYAANVFYSFFIIGGFYLSLSICLRKQFPAGDNTEELSGVGKVLIAMYLFLIIANVVLSLGSNIKSANRAFWTLSLLYALYMIIYIALLLFMFERYLGSKYVWIPVVFTLGSYMLLLCLNKCICNVLKGIIQYLLATPTYINIFTIYAVCNVHDCTWGNRSSELTAKESETKSDYERYRAYYVSFWFLMNSGFAYSFDALNVSGQSYSIFIYWVGMGGLAIVILRFLGALAFMIKGQKRSNRSNRRAFSDSIIPMLQSNNI
ncbi:hypothetical protein SteCoe_11840 [Stentor coeruleus]|uniref:chitin synthase n=1 Tax=Stentor coeruleus TaxID=5963 RepID=A0A1R2CC80_9CILI|nr:hypothetical protein SteCoe_11840 [Stentor coeruleus]